MKSLKKMLLVLSMLSLFVPAYSFNVSNLPTLTSTSQYVLTQNGMCAARVDAASATVTYVAYADMGTVDADAGWLIGRITVTGNVTLTEWANGRSTFDQVWNNRASLTYK